ncbi:endonuclease/exonuclease/phosphatase family protein [Sphingobium sp. AN558]|uniref:endonuclease/exonuclease/phosphatase family protein n=1 Tax=Sphingobium sp. AN558 TaxID=3133442 RepID=UPI0030BEAC5D
MRKTRAAMLLLAIVLTMGASRPTILPTSLPRARPPPFYGDLSVMTYNIHGLPWPVAWGRAAELARIASRLRALREAGRNPHIVALQEAFTQEAQSIGRTAGYHYVVTGPSAVTTGAIMASGSDSDLARNPSWLKGEGIGKYVGSGLQILSDYPITGIRRMTFPAFACGGYDCLANKGALLASIKLPDRPDPIDIVTTHLNSRHASKVSDDRSLEAYRIQLALLTDFIHKAHDPARALIVAGDFNVGNARARRAILLGDIRSGWSSSGTPVRNAYDSAVRAGLPISADAVFSRRRARDWQFYASVAVTGVDLTGIDVPFGHAADGSMLSDHIGYTVRFRLSRRSVPATSFARSTATATGAAPA